MYTPNCHSIMMINHHFLGVPAGILITRFFIEFSNPLKAPRTGLSAWWFNRISTIYGSFYKRWYPQIIHFNAQILFSPWPVTIYIEVRTSKNISAVRILDSRFCQMKCELHPEPMMSLAVMCSQRSKSQKTTLVNSVLGAHWENVELKNQG